MRERARSTAASRRETADGARGTRDYIQDRHGFDRKPTPEFTHPPGCCRGRCRYTPSVPPAMDFLGGMGPGMRASPRPAVVGGHGRILARSGLRSLARPLPRENGFCCGGHPELDVRRSRSAIRIAAGRSRHPSDCRVPQRCDGTAAQAGSIASAFCSAGTVGALDLQRIGART